MKTLRKSLRRNLIEMKQTRSMEVALSSAQSATILQINHLRFLKNSQLGAVSSECKKKSAEMLVNSKNSQFRQIFKKQQSKMQTFRVT